MKKEKKQKSEHKQNWKEYTATVEDIEQFLRDNIFLRHNVITGRGTDVRPVATDLRPHREHAVAHPIEREESASG